MEKPIHGSHGSDAHPIRILLVEDSREDAELALAELAEDALAHEARVVDDETAYLAALRDFAPDIVLSDLSLPGFSGQRALERISIRNSLANLRTFPCVKILEQKGKINLHGAWFDISTGELWIMDAATGDFRRPGM